MNNRTHHTRRDVLGGVAALALTPWTAGAQTLNLPTDFAARARALTGFDPIPRPLLRQTRMALNDTQRAAFVSRNGATDALQKTVLKALYTGIYTPERGAQRRLSYAQALMHGAIEDTVNVPSYCGGAPAYWAEKPQTA